MSDRNGELMRFSTGVLSLSSNLLASRDIDSTERVWALEEIERIRRLQTAARDLGIDMPANWCRRY
ncbi:hypothetical protein ACEQ8H_006756 [Pleosporales sp. CAS-2024a]